MTEQGIPPAKVIMMGESSVGKTSIVYKFSRDQYDEAGTPTIGACYITKIVEVDNKKLALHVWDTAGQERFRSIIPMYLRGSLAVIFVCSADSPESIDKLNEWREVVITNQPETKVNFVVFNKFDINSPDLEQKAVEFAQSHGYSFIKTSAKENINIINLFEAVAKKILENTDISKLESSPALPIKVAQPKKKESSCNC
ncbi:small GTP-binding protein, putative [Trichomonas vaginalis G3]|uniref:Small GTP-binding protein, putative n=1 Tax=Trichomonas vaginalis (strain ATCC PRA-98 / G3) TaxID=412133 RepID=A2EAU9_TRIV3|nr:GTPase protein [Trichomonas vaginalis G3]EAY10194.1 small GTP-binding protein, putative [Trichomonas vaginalis G3]KAI5513619.1 GTPase protein [Trichomonas vaginalis G3]|eukprot:XP_001322417.1 small GTP-binding protein [Trichomonas vaginalis G3]